MYHYTRILSYTTFPDANDEPEINESESLFDLVWIAFGDFSNNGDYQMPYVNEASIKRDDVLIFDHGQLWDIYLTWLHLRNKGTVGNSVRLENYFREIVRLQSVVENDLTRERARAIKSHYTDAAQLAAWRDNRIHK